MRRTLVLNIVGLTPRLLGEHTPALSALARRGGMRHLRSPFPAVTCSAQATFLTGLAPSEHGIVGNGWYFRDLAEIWLWRQSHHLVGGKRLWDEARDRDPAFTCANMFWWYNMYCGADIAVTPRPIYAADGRKIPDCYAEPPALRDDLTAGLGPFPLFKFWGPAADITSSRWIAEASALVWDRHRPTLELVYLPHLDYCLQKFGPDHPAIAAELRAVDALAAPLIEQALAEGAAVIVLSEYGIVPVSRPVHVNRALRQAGLLRLRDEMGHEMLDAGASRAFAVADHQVAHVYVRDPGDLPLVRATVEGLPGVGQVLEGAARTAAGLDHPRAGELVLVAEPDAWFTYYYWFDDRRAPDFARTVEIHRKPGYDPVELFLDPALRFPRLAVAWRLAKRKLGLRSLMDVIPLDAGLVRGSHGRIPADSADGPLLISSEAGLLPSGMISPTDVRSLILGHVFETGKTEPFSPSQHHRVILQNSAAAGNSHDDLSQ